MVLYYDPLSKRESVEWHKPGEAPPKKVKVTQSAKRIMAMIFWHCRGILLIDFKERNATVNAAYSASLLHKLRDDITEKRRGILSRGICLLHDNAPVHTAAVAKGCHEGTWLRGDGTPTLQPRSGTQWLLPLLQTKERSLG